MKKAVIHLFFSLIVMSSLAITITSISIAWFLGASVKTEDKELLDGDIGLRNYFFAGDGSEENPFEIVSPVHFYNLTRLQNLGIFPEKKHFQIGHDFDDGKGLSCINEGGTEHEHFLDMSSWAKSIMPIGSEGTPFVGDFCGNGIPIKNLTVTGYPEDIGVFGYVSYEGNVDGLVCENLTIRSLGYNPNVSSDEYQLFHPEIDDLFNENAHYLAADTSCSFLNFNGSSYTKTELKHINGVGGTTYSNIDDPSKCVDGTKLYNGYFLPVYPIREGDPFTYSWTSSSALITASDALGLDLDEDGVPDMLPMVDLDLLSREKSVNNDFNSGENMQIDARLSLVASVTVEGIVYSRIIQSYLCEFKSNSSTYGDGNFSMSLYCNYVIPMDTSHPTTNYHHGNNIGFLVGHLDGSLTYSYVYHGTFDFNDSGYHPINAETQFGLVGEVGTNVINAIDPNYSSMLQGEIGVMNFTGIYEGIRRDFVAGEIMKASIDTGRKIVFYDYDSSHTAKNVSSSSLFSLYEDYLRHDPAGHSFIGTTANVGEGIAHDYQIPSPVPTDLNTVDFLFNKIVQDEYIGSWITSDTKPESGDDMGETSSLPSVPSDGAFCFAAENSKYYKWNACTGRWNELTARPISGTDLGTVSSSDVLLKDGDFYLLSSDGKYHQYQLDFNNRGLGVFKLTTPREPNADGQEYIYHIFDKLSECRIINGSTHHSKVYFSSAEYDHTVEGQPAWGVSANQIEPLRATTLPSYSDASSFAYPFSRDYNYVFELDLSQNNPSNGNNYMYNTDSEFLSNYLNSILIDKYGKPISHGDYRFGFMFRSSDSAPLNSLSSYMEITQPSNLVDYDGNGLYYPDNSIVFNIENENGANVSVVGNKNNISIYKFKTDGTGGVTKLYTMKCENTSEVDSHRYFSYDFSDEGSGATSTQTVSYSENQMGDGDALYGHIFKLDKLPDGWMYAIGSADSEANKKANLYYLAVQGQTDGTIGSTKIANIGRNLENVDFLVNAPVKADYPITSESLNGYAAKEAFFNFAANFNTSGGSLTARKYGDTSYLELSYVNDPQFVTYLFAYDYKNSPIFFINDASHTRSTETIIS